MAKETPQEMDWIKIRYFIHKITKEFTIDDKVYGYQIEMRSKTFKDTNALYDYEMVDEVDVLEEWPILNMIELTFENGRVYGRLHGRNLKFEATDVKENIRGDKEILIIDCPDTRFIKDNEGLGEGSKFLKEKNLDMNDYAGFRCIIEKSRLEINGAKKVVYTVSLCRNVMKEYYLRSINVIEKENERPSEIYKCPFPVIYDTKKYAIDNGIKIKAKKKRETKPKANSKPTGYPDMISNPKKVLARPSRGNEFLDWEDPLIKEETEKAMKESIALAELRDYNRAVEESLKTSRARGQQRNERPISFLEEARRYRESMGIPEDPFRPELLSKGFMEGNQKEEKEE